MLNEERLKVNVERGEAELRLPFNEDADAV